jgi:hypothetical protein
MSTNESIAEVVEQLAGERPGWLVVLRACCVVARGAEVLGLGFAGSWVRQQLEEWGAPDTIWFPGLTLLERRGLITMVAKTGGPLHFLMPHRSEIEDALAGLGIAYRHSDSRPHSA